MSEGLSIFLLFVVSMDLFLLVNANDRFDQNCTLTSEKFKADHGDYLQYSGFTNLSQLNFECDSTAHFKEFNMTQGFHMYIWFNKMNLLYETVDLSSFNIFLIQPLIPY